MHMRPSSKRRKLRVTTARLAEPHTYTIRARVHQNSWKRISAKKLFATISYFARTCLHGTIINLPTALKCCWTFVEKNICLVKTDRNFRIFCFPNATAYREFLAKKLQQKTEVPEGTDSKLSNYDTERDAVFTCSQPDLTGTIDSVLTKVFEDQPFADKWSIPQFATLFSRSFGYSSNNECQLYLAQDARCYSIPSSPRPLVELINTSIVPQDEKSSCLVALFLIRTGKWRAYFDLCQSGKVSDYATVFEERSTNEQQRLSQNGKRFSNNED